MEKDSSRRISLDTDQLVARIGRSSYVIRVLEEGAKAEVDGHSYSVSLVRGSDDSMSLLLDNLSFRISVLESSRIGDHNLLILSVNGNRFPVEIEDRRTRLWENLLGARPVLKKAEEVRAPMPGKVVRIEVKIGEEVTPGTGLFILEAMKMENEIKSSTSGLVESITVTPSQSVEKGEVLLSIKPN